MTNKRIILLVDKPNISEKFMVNSDLLRIKQIFYNLIGNSVKFTEKGYVKFGYKEHDSDKIELFVEDTGIGIPENKLNVIFDRFTKVEELNTKLYGGVGLGLAITKKIVELLYSEIKVKSKIGEGTCFSIIIDVGT